MHRLTKQSSGSNSAFSTKRSNSSEYITAVCGATLASVVTVNLSSAISRENTADSPVPALQWIDKLFCIVQILQPPADLSICPLYLSQLCEKNIKVGVQKSASYCPARLQHPLCATAPPCFDGIRRSVLTKFLENYGGKKCQRRRRPRRRQR